MEIIEVDEINRRCRCQIKFESSSLSVQEACIRGFQSLAYAFDVLHMRKVCVEVCADEITQHEVYRKLGFCEEGRLTRHVIRADKAWDLILLAHFRESWEKKRKSLEEALLSRGVVS